MGEVTFALIREGTSDNGLVPHIRSLILKAGADAAIGAPREYKGMTSERLALVIQEDTQVDLVFVHRDADSPDPLPRHTEVQEAALAHPSWATRVVPIVPTQELEAWLLTDEDAIRRVVGRPNGRVPLGLPGLRHVEETSSPKEVLKSACMLASETTGARKAKVARAFPSMRATLLERLDVTGPVTTLTSWQTFVRDVSEATRLVLLTLGEGDVPRRLSGIK